MSTEITLCIEDDGTMFIKTGEAPETPAQEQTEGGTKHPVASIDEALAMIKALANAAATPQDASQGDNDGPADTSAPGEEDDGQEAAMAKAYRPGVRG